jgi:hypothetical protein
MLVKVSFGIEHKILEVLIRKNSFLMYVFFQSVPYKKYWKGVFLNFDNPKFD